MMRFRVDNDMQRMFVCGSGVAFSTNRENDTKRIQWVVLIQIGDNIDPMTSECSDERNVPYVQKQLVKYAEEFEDKYAQFEERESVKKADTIIERILKEPLPTIQEYFIDFECLKDR